VGNVAQRQFAAMTSLLRGEVTNLAQCQPASSAQLSVESADARRLNSKNKAWQSTVIDLKWFTLGLCSVAPK
jgi:hypothetical protein